MLLIYVLNSDIQRCTLIHMITNLLNLQNCKAFVYRVNLNKGTVIEIRYHCYEWTRKFLIAHIKDI